MHCSIHPMEISCRCRRLEKAEQMVPFGALSSIDLLVLAIPSFAQSTVFFGKMILSGNQIALILLNHYFHYLRYNQS